MAEPLPIETVQTVARLAHLELTDEQAERSRHELARVLGYIERLRQVDVEGIEPMSHPTDATNRLDADEIGPTLTTDQLMTMASQTERPFIRVPKVLGTGDASGGGGGGGGPG